MTSHELRTAIEVAIVTVPLTTPVSVRYCMDVRDALRAAVPGAGTEVYVRGNTFIAKVWLGSVEAEVPLLLT